MKKGIIFLTLLNTTQITNISAKTIQRPISQKINISQKESPIISDKEIERKIITQLKIFLEKPFEKQKKLRKQIKTLLGKHINILIKQKIDLNKYKYIKIKKNDPNYFLNLLHVTALVGYIKGTNSLLKNNANPNIKNNKLNTPLHYTVNKTIAQNLIAKGAIVDAQNYIGSTPLHQTARYGNFGVVEALIENKAEINKLSNTDRSSLHLAIENRDVKICKLLIKNGADINSNKNSVKYTPLHTAILGLDKKICKLLIKNNADINLKDIYGNTPLDLLNKLDK